MSQLDERETGDMGRRKGGKGVVLVETKTGRRPLIESHICSGPVRALSPTLLPSSSTSLPSPFFPLLFSGARAFSSVFSYRLVGYETGGGRKKLVDAYRNRGLELKYSGNIRLETRGGGGAAVLRCRMIKKILYFIFLLIRDIITFLSD